MSHLVGLIDWLLAGIVEYFALRNASLDLYYSLFASLVFSTTFVVSLFAYRAFDEENMFEILEQASRVVLSVLVSVVFTSLVFSIFRSKLAFRPTVIASIILILVVPSLNVWIFRVKLANRRPLEYVVCARGDAISRLMETFQEVEVTSNGRIRFRTYVNLDDDLTALDSILEELPYDSNIRFLITETGDYEWLSKYLRDKHVMAPISHVADVVERNLKRIPLVLAETYRQYYELQFHQAHDSRFKRIFDIFLATAGLVLTAPLLLFAVILVILEDGLPAFYKQPRVGRYGKVFTFVKVRTLKELPNMDRRDPNATIEPRVLKTGKFLRMTRLDELPQFWLVLKGEMSIVGPRPEMVEYHEKYSRLIPFYNYRLNVKPGLTGWAQINYKHTTTLEEYIKKTEYDLYYIKNHNLLLDLQIILQTLEAVFWRRGAR